MTTTTAVRPREFTVTEATTSKQLYDQLSSLNNSNNHGQPEPIRAYEGKSKGTTRIKIYDKKTKAAQKLKAAANPQRVSARILVIKTIEKILVKELANCSSEKEKEKFNQALTNIKSKQPSCNHHDLRIPDLINDLQPLQAVWAQSNLLSEEKISTAPSAIDARSPQHHESTKKTGTPKNTAPKTISAKTANDINPKEKKALASDKTKNSALIHNQKAPRLKVAQTSFDLSTAISFLESVKKYSDNLNSESSSKISFRIGKIKDSNIYSFYISNNDSRKIKKNSKQIEGRESENKNITSKRAIEMMRTIANSLVQQNRLTAEEVNTVFSTIEKQKFIGMKDIPPLLELLEKGRRAAISNATPIITSSVSGPATSKTIHFNTNPFDEKSTTAGAVGANTNPFEEITTPENTPSTISKPTNKISTNPFEDVSTKENFITLPAPPDFFQRMSNFFKPVTIFFASVRRFFGFN